ncbi:MAG: hypothetical protein KDJ36_08355, partial [Hyphomicrobiaceae bacterium]|nr:hypothetical protein [Hyphomicrobiaceae bacterium]
AAGQAAGIKAQPNGLATDQHGNSDPRAGDDDLMVTLRETMADLAAVTEKRATRAAVHARATMVDHPWLTIAGAATAGAIVAVAATRKSGDRSRSVSVAGYSVPVPALNFPSQSNLGVGPAINMLGGYAERMIDAIARTDPKALSSGRIGEAIDGVRGLLSSVSDVIPRR